VVGDLGLIFGRTFENGRRQELGPVNSRGGVGICRHVYVEIARDILNRNAGRPAGGLPFGDGLVRHPRPIFVLRLQRLQIFDWDHGGDRLPIANEDDAFLVVFCTRCRLGETTAVLAVVGGKGRQMT
jgi:hypothetical protein